MERLALFLICSLSLNPRFPVAAETPILDANEEENQDWDADEEAFEVGTGKRIIVGLQVVLLELVKLEFHQLD